MPEGWAWCRLGEYLDIRDGTHDSPKYVEKGFPFVTSKNLVNGKIDFTDVKYISEKDHNNFVQRSFVEDGDILFAMIGSIGNPVLVKKDREFSIKNVALFKPNCKQYTNMVFVYYYLLWLQESLKTRTKGGMQPFIPLNLFRNDLFIPLPPSNEQTIIIESLEQILHQISSVKNDKTDLQEIIKQAKSKILDLAIHGKLVPQDPNDESAEELLKRIATSDNRP
ncbi:restriction endonuclease subunit S, partial [Treponema pectinovorum]|uniref:restriction endonuclease subunit S n=1 Tax=Treponema pectinovorum TaxID=164 RepID=UPI00164E97FA